MDFAEDMGFANPPGDQLRDLGAKVENKNFVVLHGIGRLQLIFKASDRHGRRFATLP